MKVFAAAVNAVFRVAKSGLCFSYPLFFVAQNPKKCVKSAERSCAMPERRGTDSADCAESADKCDEEAARDEKRKGKRRIRREAAKGSSRSRKDSLSQ